MYYKVNLIFEDRYYSVDCNNEIVGFIGTSFMLKKGYSNSDVNVVFAKKNTRLKKFVKQLKDNEVTVLFPDLSVDNYETWLITTNLMEKIINNNYKNILVFPIPCIEFIFIKGFSNLAIRNLQSIQNVINRECYLTDILYVESKLPKKNLSFETFCKACIQNCFDISISKNRIKNNSSNVFYYSDKIEEKNWRLITSLPVFENTDDNTYFNISSVNVANALRDEMQLIINQTNVYKSNNLIDFEIDDRIKIFEDYIKFLESQ